MVLGHTFLLGLPIWPGGSGGSEWSHQLDGMGKHGEGVVQEVPELPGPSEY